MWWLLKERHAAEAVLKQAIKSEMHQDTPYQQQLTVPAFPGQQPFVAGRKTIQTHYRVDRQCSDLLQTSFKEGQVWSRSVLGVGTGNTDANCCFKVHKPRGKRYRYLISRGTH